MCTWTLETVSTKQRLSSVKGIFKEKTLPSMEAILFSVSSIRYETLVQSLLLLIRAWWLEVLEIQIFSHLIVRLQTLYLNRSLLSIMNMILQSHFLAMTLKISISPDVSAIFASPSCPEGKVLLEPQHRSQPQNNDHVMTRHSKNTIKRKKALDMLSSHSKS